MNINTNYNVGSVKPEILPNSGAAGVKPDFSKTAKLVEKFLSGVEDQQQVSDLSIKDLLAGRTNDIQTVVAEVARADMSFKLLVGVRNKLIDAYKQTMNMQI